MTRAIVRDSARPRGSGDTLQWRRKPRTIGLVRMFISVCGRAARLYAQHLWRMPRVASSAQLGEPLVHKSPVEVWGHGLFLSVGVM